MKSRGTRRPARTRRLGTALCLGAALLAACTPMGAVRNIAGNGEQIAGNLRQPGAVAAARNTYLLRSGRVFFPDNEPLQPGRLPDLSDAQVDLITLILETELQGIRDAQSRLAATLGREFPGHDAARVRLTIEAEARDTAWAGSQPDTGHITIDARVVQAIYRAALIATFAPESEVGTQMPMARREAFAFQRFASFRSYLAAMPSLRLLGDLRAFTRGASAPDSDPQLGRALAGASEMMNSRLADSGAIIVSRELEREFLGAIRFMLAHEAGHVALSHPIAPQSCAQAVANEYAADRYAVVVSNLAAFPRIPGNVLRGGVLIEPDEAQNHPSDGARPFFSYAYGLAGFDSRFATLADCRYPSPEERLAAIGPLAALIHTIHGSAMYDQSLRRFGSAQERRRLAAAPPFEAVFATLPRQAETDGPFPADLAPFNLLLRDIFYDTYNRDY